ncbi:MAG: alpha-xylosidase, partial [Prevotella sp.]|nr:alpha-xylosidase [Prevotella sp.]
NLSVLIDIAETDCTKEKTVTVTFPKNAAPVADGLIGKFRHIQQGCIAIKSRTPGFLFNEQLGTMESTGVAISYAPQEAAERIEAFRRNYANLKQVLVESGMAEAEADKFVQKAY